MIARHKLGLKRYVPGAKNSRGNVADSWADPVEILAFSIGPAYQREDGGRLVSTGLVVGLPTDHGIRPRDRVLHKGLTWEVDGELIDSNLGPFPYHPGFVMNLKRVSG